LRKTAASISIAFLPIGTIAATGQPSAAAAAAKAGRDGPSNDESIYRGFKSWLTNTVCNATRLVEYGNTDMSSARLAELKAVRERIEELQERHWFAEKRGKHQRAQQLAQELLGAQAECRQLVDRIMNPTGGA
jgi:urease accessory protein UreF